MDHELFEKGIKDSKKLTPKRRDTLYAWIQEHAELRSAVGFSSAQIIDRRGIVPATKLAMADAMRKVLPDDCDKWEVKVLLDGGLHAHPIFTNQETIIKGDEKEVLIALASVIAKVSRDREMEKMGEQYPQYDFAKHKGYGTKKHYEAIRKNGFCDEHRRSFLTRVVVDR
ncbi:MAG: ribonuclease HII [Candidatus Pacebacteria bacterium]|nr:ribonuclease HII [Candidatus Paceibacterota bacterium]